MFSITSEEFLFIIFYLTIGLGIMSMGMLVFLIALKNYIDSLKAKIDKQQTKFEIQLKESGLVHIELKSKVEVLALSEVVIKLFKTREHKKKLIAQEIVKQHNLADKIYKFYKYSFISFYRYYYSSLLVELRSKKYRVFFEKILLDGGIETDKAGYYLYALAILKNDYNDLVTLYTLLQRIYNFKNTSQLFSELIISEAFENMDYKEINNFFRYFLIKQKVSPVFLAFIYAIDERKDDDWGLVLKLFCNKYYKNKDVKEALTQMYNELYSDKSKNNCLNMEKI